MMDFLSLFWDFFFFPLQNCFDIDNPLFTVLGSSIVIFAVYRVTLDFIFFHHNEMR